MARGCTTRRIPGWTISLAITLAVLVTALVRPAFLEAIEYQLSDLRPQWFGSRAPVENIAMVAIDEESITKLMSRPRSRVACLSQTKRGTVMGSPSHMLPEQIGGEKVDGRSDPFPLGVMLYELLTGERPFQGDSIAISMFQVTSSAPPLANIVPTLPPIFQELIEKALAKDPAQRFQTGEEFAKTLRALKDRLDKGPAQAGGGDQGTARPGAPSRAAATQRLEAAGGSATQQLHTQPGSAEG